MSDKTEIRNTIIYPIPANDMIHLNNINPLVNKLEIVDATGKLMLALNIQNVEQGISINTSTLLNGTYHIKLSNHQNHLESKTIVIQHD